MATRKSLREKVKLHYVDLLTEYLSGIGEDVLRVGSNEIAFPTIDEEGNEDFIVLVVKIPTGANKGTEPYDGYEMAQEYQMKLEEKKIKAQKSAEAKAKKVERDKIRREKEKENKLKREEK